MKWRMFVLLLTVWLLFLFLLSPVAAGAALREPTWGRRTPQDLTTIAATPAGGTVTVAPRYIARYSANGTELWHRRAPAGDVAFGPDGTVVTAGTRYASGASCPRWFIRVYGPSGGLRWSRTMARCSPAHNADLISIAVTEHTIVLAANRVPYDSPGSPECDAYVMEFSLHGRLLRSFDIEPTAPAWNDSVEGVAVGAAGTIFVTGWADLGPWTTDAAGHTVVPNRDPYVMAFSPTGSAKWKTMLHDHGPAYVENGLSIDLGAGVLAVVADVLTRDRHMRAYRVVRFSTGGRRLWIRTIPTRTDNAFWAEVAVAPTGWISLVASHEGRPLLRTFRPNGTVAWSARVGSGLRPSLEYDEHDVDAGSAGVFVAGSRYVRAEVIRGWLFRYRP